MALFVEAAKAAGYPIEAYTLRTVGNREMTVADDAAYMQSVIKPHVEEGKDVVFIIHSYAGFPATEALSGGLDKRTREANGKTGGIVGAIWLAAFMPMAGDAVYTLLGSKWLHWHSENKEAGLLDTLDQANTFYGDVDAKLVNETIPTLKGHSLKALTAPDGIPVSIGWAEKAYDGRRAYIRCTQDNALAFEVQSMFIERSGVTWITKTMETSHSPFMSRPKELVEIVSEIVKEFYAAK